MTEPTPAGVAIRKARQRQRMTQADLAAKLDVAVSTVANWERGFHYPQRFEGAIEDVLGITLPGPQPEVAS